MENRQVPTKLLVEWEGQAMREGITNPHAFMSFIKDKTERYFQSLEEVSLAEQKVFDGCGNLTAHGLEWASRSLTSLPRNKRIAEVIRLEYLELLDYLSKKGEVKNGKELFDPDTYKYMVKSWYKHIISRLDAKLIDRSDIPFKEYRKFAYSKI